MTDLKKGLKCNRMHLEARPGEPFFVCGALGRKGVHPSLPEECVASTEQSSERIPHYDRPCPNCERPEIVYCFRCFFRNIKKPSSLWMAH